MNRIVCVITVLMIAAGTLPACRTGKKPVRKDLVQDTSGVTEARADSLMIPLPEISEEKRELISHLMPLKEKAIRFRTFSGKAKMHYEGGGEKHDLVAGIRIREDSLIWVSVSALGGLVQVARIKVTPDSILLINYLQREVTAMAAADAGKLLPADIDFKTLQNLLIGNLLRDGGTPTDATDFGGTWSLRLEDGQYIQQIAYNKADSTMRSSQVRTRQEDPSTELMIQFGNYETINGQRFPVSRMLHVMTGQGQHYLDMNFNNVEINQPTDFPFSIPKKYTMK